MVEGNGHADAPKKRWLLAGVVATAGVLAALARPPAKADARALATTAKDWDLAAESLTRKNASMGRRAKPLVLVAGLSRTGTSSLQEALIALNLTVHHTYETITHHLDFWYYYLNGEIARPNVRALIEPLDVDAISDCWYAHLAPEILREYPDAKVILTTRDPTSWLRSYEAYIDNSDLYHWSRQIRRLVLSRFSRLLGLGTLFRTSGLIGPATGLDLDNLPVLMDVWHRIDRVIYGANTPNPLWRGAYERHNAYVRSLVPEDQLMEFSFGDTWTDLVRFLEIDVDTHFLRDKPFPRLNCVASKSCVSHVSAQLTATHERLATLVLVVVILLSLALVDIGHFTYFFAPPPRLLFPVVVR
ncbi:hypothetical protein CTAYLR_003342 [Chrysophaeum taylorii]|uniref:Sulfotransferase n=1 Tax=Chrysophaeum taylorii TaxID=2483200 RepID=A0AAD7XJ59_9STRA|nr:hypothetical protein CTAYLR_003342 [Chrysophaeum taylorii]